METKEETRWGRGFLCRVPSCPSVHTVGFTKRVAFITPKSQFHSGSFYSQGSDVSDMQRLVTCGNQMTKLQFHLHPSPDLGYFMSSLILLTSVSSPVKWRCWWQWPAASAQDRFRRLNKAQLQLVHWGTGIQSSRLEIILKVSHGW